MYLEETDATKKLRKEIREYFSTVITPEIRDNTFNGIGGELYRKTIRQIGKDNWLAMGWPKEYGGGGRDSSEQVVFFEEAHLAGAPLPFIALNTVGPALMARGSEEHKKLFLPKIASGEIIFAIGYTEPNSGTDLASLKTAAVRDGDDYVINGSKIFTTTADDADYIWLAVRTDPDAPVHKGISIIMVDTTLPGFSLTPIQTVGSSCTATTYYDNVRVPASMLVGKENEGWKLITSQLNFERVGLAAIGVDALGMFDSALAWLKEERENGARVIDEPWVQRNVAEAYSLLEALRLMNKRMAWQIENNQLEAQYASAVKVFGSESMVEVARLLLDVIGSLGIVRRGSKGAVIQGKLEYFYRKYQILTFGGGVNEVQREIVASMALGMPRTR